MAGWQCPRRSLRGSLRGRRRLWRCRHPMPKPSLHPKQVSFEVPPHAVREILAISKWQGGAWRDVLRHTHDAAREARAEACAAIWETITEQLGGR
jgi:hypothetical protein